MTVLGTLIRIDDKKNIFGVINKDGTVVPVPDANALSKGAYEKAMAKGLWAGRI